MENRPEPIAVIGTGFRFPGHANTPSKLWDLLQNPSDLLTPIPDDRFSAKGFYHRSGQYHGHSNVKDSYLLAEENVQRRFDAQFFGITPAEANIMDPQTRLLLETVYEALEAGGQTIEDLRGSDTAVYAGLMTDDYKELMLRDVDGIGTYHATGTSRSLLSNRLSYFFDWHGPSMTIDTACSSSLVAVHQAVQQLRSRQSRVAIAVGANLILDPQYYVTESKLQMLSPDSRSRMWDADANGYARGEAVAAVVLKPLSAAEADGDHIECVIRETATNQDGRTKGITLPSGAAQAQLIRDCYARAGLNTTRAADRPQYFEAHGTGTPAGDPIEAEAISVAFPPIQDEVLHVGSVKTVLGHSEGAAGLTALIKGSLAVQNAIIPPNLLFNCLNPSIEPFYAGLRVPTLATPWPELPHEYPRRASVNSFGFTGTNAHAILESYTPIHQASLTQHAAVFMPFVFSAATESSLVSYIASFSEYLRVNEATTNLRDLSFTLHSRRTCLPFTAAVAAPSVPDLYSKLEGKLETARMDAGRPVGTRTATNQGSESGKPAILGVFTGQGAQWACMGSELVASSAAALHVIQKLEDRLSQLPANDRPSWSLIEELQKESSSRIGEAALSQPLCTAIQVLQVDLLRAAGVEFAAVVGHSSGEIAAAYAAGLISAEDAICVAYYRGLYSGLARGLDGEHGAMMAIGSSFEDVQELCEAPDFKGRICVAAINSSVSVTVSGDQDAIEELKIILEDENKFARLLKVEKAYHSHHMIPCSETYLQSLRAMDVKVQPGSSCAWYSSVYGEEILPDKHQSLKGTYWDSNMLHPVLFAQAIKSAHAAKGPFDLAIEVGPHPALKQPTLQTLQDVSSPSPEILYTSLFYRGRNDVESIANGLGYIWTHLGRGSIDLQAYDCFVSENAPAQLIKGLPTYAWNHEKEYWHESRYARAVRTRPEPVHELLGHLTPDSTRQEMRWRHLLRPKEVPWLNGHRLQDQTVFPAAGYVIAALEAAIVLCNGASATLFEIIDLDLGKALTFNNNDSSTETVFSLTDIVRHGDHTIDAKFRYNAAAGSHGDSLDLLASGRLRVCLGEYTATALPARSPRPPNLLKVHADQFYASLQKLDYDYSGPFAALCRLERKLGVATGYISNIESSEMLVHPAVLDASFQSIMLAHSCPGDGSLWSMHVPRAIKCVRFNPQLCMTEMAKGKDLLFDALQPADSTGIAGDVYIYPEDGLGHAMIQVEGLDCVPFSQAAPKDDRVLFSTTAWDVASPDVELVTYDGLATPEQHQQVTLLERVAGFYLRTLDRDVPSDHPSRSDGPHVFLYRFASHVRSQAQAGKLPLWRSEWENDTNAEIAALCEQHADVVDIELLHAIGENLVAIAQGGKQAIEIGMAENLLTKVYQNAIGVSTYTQYLARAVKQIIHRYPHMHVLEIGAGTGSATRGIFAAVDPTAFASYTFTDITPGFFSTAQAAFNAPNVIFKVLDISRDPREQGFTEPHSYDMLVASSVLHATPVLEETLWNARRLLKPGGYLFVLEGLPTDTTRVGTMFGAFPGWWLGADDGRVLTPYIGLAEWDELLRKTGFSGCDTVTPDPEPLVMPFTLFVSQAVDDKISFLHDPFSSNPELFAPGTLFQDLVLLGGTSLKTSRLVGQLQHLLRPYCTCVKTTRSLVDLSAIDISSVTTILSLTDLDEPIFKHLTEQKWKAMKSMLIEARTILWVTQGRRGGNPYANMTIGLLRSCIHELPALSFQFLDIEDPQKLEARTLAEALVRLRGQTLWQQEGIQESIHTTIEPELVLDKQGRFMIPRLVPSQEMNDRYNSSRRAIFSRKLPYAENVGVGVSSSGLFIQHNPMPALEGQRIRVSHSIFSAVKVDLGCMFIMLGRDLNSEEQVVALSTKHTYIMCPWENLSVPITAASGSEAEFLTLVTYYMLASSILNGLSKGDSIVVSEPDPTFATILSREADSNNIDVIFTTSHTAPHNPNWLTIQYTTPRRLIHSLLPKDISVYLDFSLEGGARSIGNHLRSQLPVHCKYESLKTLFTRESWTPSGSHADGIRMRLQNAATSAIYALREIHKTVTPQLPIIASSDLSGLGEEPVPLSVIDWMTTSDVSIRVQPIDSYPLFSESKTYWLAGLSGGLGLSLCEWMTRHGARYIVLSSRTPNIQESWLKQIGAGGAVIKVFTCDNTKKDDVEAVYASIYSTLPPIAGVAQGAMVLQDTTFSDMTLDILSKVMRPKVEGSIYISNLFQKDTLEFFIFFSSISAVVGCTGQSNYTAANLFMTGLAEQRRQCGLAASTINIGPIFGVGYIAQDESAAKAISARFNEHTALSERDFHQLFAEAVVSGRPGSGRAIEITTGARRISPYDEEQPEWARNPIMSHFILNHQSASQVTASARTRVPTKTQLAQAQTQDQVSIIIRDGFIPKLCALFQLGADKLADADLGNLRLDEMGIDSLLASEIRSWFIKTFEVNIPVLQILSGATVGELIAVATDKIPLSLVPNVQPDIPSPRAMDALELQVVDSQSKLIQTDEGLETTASSFLSSSGEQPSSSLSTPSKPASSDNNQKPITSEPILLKSLKLSLSQEIFWFVFALLEDKTTLNHSASFRLTGRLRVDDLKEAVQAIGQQHETIRTCFFEKDNRPMQGIMESSTLHLEQRHILDEAEVEQERDDMQNYVFDLKHGKTMRIVLLSLAPTSHFLVLGTHGLVMDGLSLQVFMKDLQLHYLYTGQTLETTRQFSDYSEKQHDDYNKGKFESVLRFWRTEFCDFPLPLPILRVSEAVSRHSLTAYENERVDIRIDSKTRAQIQEVCRHYRVTAFHFYLAAFRALLSRYSDAEDISIGIGDANRLEDDIMGIIGMFVNLLPLRFCTLPSARFAVLLEETRSKVYGALANSRVPFQVLLNELNAPRSATHTPIFQCFVNYRQGRREKTAWADCQLEMLSFQASKAAYDLGLDIIDNPDGETLLMLVVRKDLYDDQAAEHLIKSYARLVESFAADPSAALSQPALFKPEEVEEAMRFSQGPSHAPQWPKTIVHRIDNVAKTHPQKPAVLLDDGTTITYASLLDHSNSIAVTLQAAKVTARAVVAVLQEPTAAWVASLLAIMRIGAVYLPLDLGTPWARLAAVVQDCQPSAVLVDNDTKQYVHELQRPEMESINIATLKLGKPRVPDSSKAESAAMILYTSGSTGLPKGIVLKHEGLQNWIEPAAQLCRMQREVVLQQSSVNFDMSFTQIATALCFGGVLYLLPRHMRGDARAIGEAIASLGITFTCATPSEYSSWLRYSSTPERLRHSDWKLAVCGGEPVTKSLLRQFAALNKSNLCFFNMYGPSEISLVATAMEVSYRSKHTQAIAAGYPLSNCSVYVVDEQLRTVPPGVQGEIYIGGAGVASGYLNNAALTSERFIPDVFATTEFTARGWTTMHRTGDIGRWRADGSILIEGRISEDTQVKLRGVRMDLREIEKTIIETADGVLSEAVVTAHSTAPESPEFLVARVLFNQQFRDEGFRAQCLQQLHSRLPLPQSMCPAVIIPVENLPMTSSSKLDRKAIAALPLLEDGSWNSLDNGESQQGDTISLTETEARLKDIWEVVVPGPAISMLGLTPQTDFFHVGGTSLSLLELQASVRTTFGVELPVAQMFESSTIAGMAHRIENSTLRAHEAFLDWDKETELPSSLLLSATGNTQIVVPAIHGKVVVLTGATGFLGQALLAALDADPRVETVHCIAVRNASQCEISCFAKAVLHEGNLNLPRLGLSEYDAQAIFSTAELIIHNGADVSYLKGYSSLRVANLQSTKELATLCLPRLIPFHYISTAAVAMFAAASLGPHSEFATSSAAPYPPPVNLTLPTSSHNHAAMTATKWASERFLERLVTERFPAWPVCVHRPSLIERRADTDGPGLDIVSNLRYYAHRLHAVPVICTGLDGARSLGRLNLVPLEIVLRGILQAALEDPTAGHAGNTDGDRDKVRFLHHLGEVELPLGDIGSWVLQEEEESDKAVDIDLAMRAVEELPIKEWARRAGKCGMHSTVITLLESLMTGPDIIFPRYIKS